MTNFIAVNNFQTTLAAAAGSSATTLSLSSAAGLPGSIPAGTVMPLTLNDAATRSIFEIVYVTAISGTSVTVERGQEGTAAQNWGIGDIAYSASTAAYEQALAYGNGQTYAADTGTANAYVVALQPAVTTRIIDVPIRVKIANTNTGASTLNYGAGNISITTRDGSALIGGEMQAGAIVEFIDDGTHCQMFATRGRLINVQIFTASGTYTPTPGMQTIIAYVQGGGAGGAGATQPSVGNVSLGSPGTAGAYGEGKFTIAQVGASQTVTVGAAGTGGSGAAGNNGGTSSLGTLLSCPGGIGGGMLNNQSAPTVNATGSATSAPSGANIVAERGSCSSPTIAMSTTAAVSGAGGRSAFGDGGNAVGVNAGGANAQNYGAGGGGVVINNGGGGSYKGGDGMSGILIIREYA